MRPEKCAIRTVRRDGLNRSIVLMLFALTLVLASVLGAAASRAEEPLFARMETGKGNILLVFYPDLAPHHVGNFVHLSRTGFYDGSKFHRIVPGFVIQGGDPNSKDADPRNDGLGGPSMTDVLTEDDANDRGLTQAKDIVWTASGGSIPASGDGARYAVLLDDNATVGSREVLAWWDLTSDRSVSDGQTLTLQDCELRLNAPA